MKNQQKTYWPLTWLLSPQRGRFDSWAALALALLVLGGMRGYLFHEQYQDITAREKDRLRGQALVIAKNLERQLLGVNNALRGCLTEMPHWRREGWPARWRASRPFLKGQNGFPPSTPRHKDTGHSIFSMWRRQ